MQKGLGDLAKFHRNGDESKAPEKEACLVQFGASL